MELKTIVSCCADNGKKHTFYFVPDKNGYPLPQYCENANGGKVCKECAVMAVKQLIEEWSQDDLNILK